MVAKWINDSHHELSNPEVTYCLTNKFKSLKYNR